MERNPPTDVITPASPDYITIMPNNRELARNRNKTNARRSDETTASL
ncbi:MAG: hypothetical protein ACPLX7_04685 [Candidatus Kapaibacteriota bacterium]